MDIFRNEACLIVNHISRGPLLRKKLPISELKYDRGTVEKMHGYPRYTSDSNDKVSGCTFKVQKSYHKREYGWRIGKCG